MAVMTAMFRLAMPKKTSKPGITRRLRD